MESIHQNHLLQFAPKSNSIPFQEAALAFENWWIHEKLAMACFSIVQASTRNFDVEYDLLLPNLLELITTDPRFKDKAVLKVYHQLYLFLKKQPGLDIEGLQKLIERNIHYFGQEEKHNLFAIVYNQFVGKFITTKGNQEARRLFEHFEWALKEKLLINQDRISWDYYRNILDICIHLKEFERAREYVENLSKNFSEKEKKEIYPYFEGILLYAQGRYKEAISILYFSFPHPLLEVTARFIYLQALYVQDDWYEDEILILLDAHGRFISKNKYLKKSKTYKSYVYRYQFFRSLLKAKKPKACKKLSEDLQTVKSFSGKVWIEEKLNEKMSTHQSF